MKVNKFFPSTIRTFGLSMYPMLLDQDIVYLERVMFERIRVTDVICVKKDRHIYTHRVIYRTEKYLITKGDSSIMADGRVYPKNVIGRVSKIKRNGQIITLNELYLFQGTIYFDELKKIASEFKKNKVDYLVLKGIPHDLYYLKRHPSKIYSDCDILIRPKDKERVNAILKKLMYRTETQQRISYLQRYVGADVKEIIYYKKRSNFIFRFDIHYEINVFSHIIKLPFPFLQQISDSFTKEMMKNKQLLEVNGTKLPMLKLEDLLIYLLLHTFGHGYTGALRFEALKTLFGNKSITTKSTIDTIIEKSESYKLIHFLAPPLYLLHKYYDIHTPYEILQKRFPKKVSFSIAIYKFLSKKEGLFNDMTATYSARFRKAIFLVLYSETNVMKKLYYVLQPKLILHLCFFLTVYLETKIRKRSFR